MILCSFNRKTIKVKILDHEEYDKHSNFFIELQEPEWRRRGWTGERAKKLKIDFISVAAFYSGLFFLFSSPPSKLILYFCSAVASSSCTISVDLSLVFPPGQRALLNNRHNWLWLKLLMCESSWDISCRGASFRPGWDEDMWNRNEEKIYAFTAFSRSCELLKSLWIDKKRLLAL